MVYVYYFRNLSYQTSEISSETYGLHSCTEGLLRLRKLANADNIVSEDEITGKDSNIKGRHFTDT